MPEKFVAVLREKRWETHDVMTFVFLREDGKHLEFHPGQFVTLMIDEIPKEFGKSRAYSICSSPLDERIGLTVKIHEQGYTKYLSELPEGTKVTMIGPSGSFVFDEKTHRKVAFISGGVGITPFMSMLRYIRDRRLSTKVVLFYSSRTEEDIIFHRELLEMQKLINFKPVFFLTREEREGYELGRINAERVSKYVGSELNDFIYFLCGPTQMVVDMENMLVDELKVPKENVKTEKWG